MSRNKAFTLIELLVVVAIIGILASVVVASVNSAREKARIGAGRHFEEQVEHIAGELLVGKWDFDECSGTTTADLSGFGNNAYFASTPTWPTTTQTGLGCALGLNGIDQYMSVNQGTRFNLSSLGSFTVSGWYNMTNAATPRPFFGVGNPYNASGTGVIVTYGYPTANRVGIVLNTGLPAGSSYTFSDASTFTMGRWVFITFVATPTQATLYIDGRSIGTLDISAYGVSNLGNTPFRIGAYGDSPASQLWYGSIDSVRVFGKALTASQVNNLYSEELKINGFVKNHE